MHRIGISKTSNYPYIFLFLNVLKIWRPENCSITSNSEKWGIILSFTKKRFNPWKNFWYIWTFSLSFGLSTNFLIFYRISPFLTFPMFFDFFITSQLYYLFEFFNTCITYVWPFIIFLYFFHFFDFFRIFQHFLYSSPIFDYFEHIAIF